MFYWIKTHRLIKWLFNNQIWSIPNKSKTIYLTFDDGPTPDVTEWVLNLLKENNIKATFFCIGKNIILYPGIFKRILKEGHTVSNHTYNHKNGWKTNFQDYIEEVYLCERAISDFQNNKQNFAYPKLFRPPYGKITPKQSKFLRSKGYKIIMWDILTADFDPSISNGECIKNATQKVEPGSIIVFHDSQKAYHHLKNCLPKALAFYKKKGFTFDVIRN
ncbi:polysaccharide deacetylase family protein [Flavobacterium oreochromis]|uniref:Polysaccharide deacetylase family protein n=3 Tax=Flavobacterium TaxID=237 RepID=A0A246G8P1_9FLAO|nr:polysaccharide deacetylase family protein [Flavobacterium oreochromis]OWP75364.1 polysaccharide deacetylase family protein [Flavobacterium oreochromis]OWP77458.1 polysaccharide deacetylase family protein [Flavobacterium oreochromis]